MAKEEYDLQTLLELREREADEAEAAYAGEIEALERLKRRLDELQTELKRAIRRREDECEAFDRKVSAGDASLAEIQGFDDYVRGLRDNEDQLRDDIEFAREDVVDQEYAVERAKEALIDAQKQLKAVEKHRESWEEEQRVIARRKQSARLDEIASRRWQEKNK